MSSRRAVLGLLAVVVCAPLFAGPQAPAVLGPISQLRADAANNSSIRVIVGLRVAGYAPEARLNGLQIAAQRQNIHAVQQRVLHRHADVHGVAGHLYESLPAMTVDVDANALQQLLDDAEVASIEPNLTMVPALHDTTTQIGMPAVWNAGYDGSGWAVAVFDSGTYSAHHFFGPGRVTWEGCFSTASTQPTGPAFASFCPNGGTIDLSSSSAEPCPVADCDHGTEVAGVAAGHDFLAPGGELSGVARGSSIMSFLVTSLACADNPCQPSAQNGVTYQLCDTIAALNYINVAFGQTPNPFAHLAAINMSYTTTTSNNYTVRYGSDCSVTPKPCSCDYGTLTNAVAAVEAHGIAVVAASGNYSTTSSLPVPACVPGIVTVGGVTKGDVFWTHSDFSPELDLLAPASGYSNTVATDGIFMGIPYSVFPTDWSNPTYDPGAYGQYISSTSGTQYWRVGTSFAAPHVAGAFAVLRQAAPDLPLSFLINDLKNSGARIPTPGSTYTPRIDVNAAMTLANDRTAPAPPTNVLATGSATGVVNVSWTPASDPSGIWKYRIYRRNNSSASFANVGESTATSWSESLSAGVAAQYYVTAVDRASNESLQSNADIAVTIGVTDDPITASSTEIFGRHIGELRQIVDAWRTFSGLTPAWSGYAALTGTIHATDVTALIDNVNAARSRLGVVNFAYHNRTNGDPVPLPASGVVILSDHVQQLRDALR